MPMTPSLAESLALLSIAALAPACALPAEDPAADPQSTCGPRVELQDVELYDGASGVPRAFTNRHRRAVGLLRWRNDLALRYREEAGNVSGVRWCTGTLVASDLFLTAAHCLEPQSNDSYELPHERDGLQLRPPELAREFVVEFRHEVQAFGGPPGATQQFEVMRLEEHRYGGLDYALLRLREAAGPSNGVARISPSDARPGAAVALLQHPAGAPMKVGAGAVSTVERAKIAYDTIDTLGGSSGAGILEAASGKLVGMHTNGGCTTTGGANYGVPIGALVAASPTLAVLVDPSKDFFVGDWDDDGRADLAVFHDGCLYPDANHDEAPDVEARQCPADAGADEYFVGRFRPGLPTRLGWRRGGCLYLDTDPTKPLCYGEVRDRFEVVIADWNGDGTSDIGIQRGSCFDFDLDLDGALDVGGYCYGGGLAEDQYLAANWDGGPRDSLAVRRGNTVAIDLDRDGKPDEERVYGEGGNEAQYLAGDWNGDGRAKLAVRRRNICLMSHDADDAEDLTAEEGRLYRDFWSAPGSP